MSDNRNMRTRVMEIRRGAGLLRYFRDITCGAKNLRNTANFYIRNTMTGLRKSPETRTANETEVLHYVFSGIQKANTRSWEKNCEKALRMANTGLVSGLAAHALIHRALAAYRPIPYPSAKNWRLNYRQLDAVLKEKQDPCYCALPAQVNQQALKKTEASWDAYFASLADWKKNPGKYNARPGIPKYLRGDAATATFPYQVLYAKDNGGGLVLSLPRSGKLTIKAGRGIRTEDVVQLEVKPYYGGYQLCLTYRGGAGMPDVPESPERILGIDLGVSNLFACACNFSSRPFLIRGGYVKSLNRQYNKERSRLLSSVTAGLPPEKSPKDTKRLDALSRKRARKLRDVFYKCAHHICRMAESLRVDVIVVGWNAGIKQGSDMGKTGNQRFVSIPHEKAYRILEHVAVSYGIPVVKSEESYTSKASFLDRDRIPVYGEDGADEVVFSGVRSHRGLYTAKDGAVINADINGACNIIRKAYPDAFGAVTDFRYLTGAVDAVTCEELLGIVNKKRKKHKKKRMSDTRKICRREHRYRKRELERVFSGMSSKERIEAAREKAILAAKAKKEAKAAA